MSLAAVNRAFLAGVAGCSAASRCRSIVFYDAPILIYGVSSDVHLAYAGIVALLEVLICVVAVRSRVPVAIGVIAGGEIGVVSLLTAWIVHARALWWSIGGAVGGHDSSALWMAAGACGLAVGMCIEFVRREGA